MLMLVYLYFLLLIALVVVTRALMFSQQYFIFNQLGWSVTTQQGFGHKSVQFIIGIVHLFELVRSGLPDGH